MIKLRQATYADFASVAALHAESWEHTYRGILSDHFLDHEVRADRLAVWEERLREPGPLQHTVLATENDTVAGFVCLMLEDDPQFGALVDNLHVRAHYRKAGIGKLLLKECARIILTQTAAPLMYLWVYEKNENARTAYEKMGALHIETVDKTNDDGSESRICRYIWKDVSMIGSSKT